MWPTVSFRRSSLFIHLLTMRSGKQLLGILIQLFAVTVVLRLSLSRIFHVFLHTALHQDHLCVKMWWDYLFPGRHTTVQQWDNHIPRPCVLVRESPRLRISHQIDQTDIYRNIGIISVVDAITWCSWLSDHQKVEMKNSVHRGVWIVRQAHNLSAVAIELWFVGQNGLRLVFLGFFKWIYD